MIMKLRLLNNPVIVAQDRFGHFVYTLHESLHGLMEWERERELVKNYFEVDFFRIGYPRIRFTDSYVSNFVSYSYDGRYFKHLSDIDDF